MNALLGSPREPRMQHLWRARPICRGKSGLAVSALPAFFLLLCFHCSAFAAGVEEDLLSEIEAPAVDLAEVAAQHSILDLVLGSGAVVQGVLILLVLMSVLTWGIVITKFFSVSKAKKQSLKFEDIFWSSKNLAQINEVSSRLDSSPVAKVYRAGHRELTAILNSSEKGQGDQGFGNIESIDRALKKAKAEQLNDLEKGTTFLATTASAAPFIGLFGTVWGIMNAFIGLSQTKSSSIQAVAPGISEALIATAIGLAAAIPAAIFYNVFMQQARVLARGIDMFSAEFLNIARRHFLK